MIQDPPVLSSHAQIVQLVDFAKKNGVDTLFVQIYRENKAWFPSKIADNAVSGDLFAVLIREAHASGLQVHAWLNLLSLGSNEKAPILMKYGPDILTKNLQPKKTLADYKIDGQFFLEPGDPRVRKELSALVEEVLRRYSGLDGIQFDYIRYPDQHPAYGFTETNVRRFRRATGKETVEEQSDAWKNWKREQVTVLLGGLVKKARALRPGLQVSTTGLVPYSRAYLEAFQDWRAWLGTGLVDFVTLMCYSQDANEFEKYLRDASNKAGGLKKVNIAVGAYAFLKAPEDFKRQWRICEAAGSRSCVVFHYGSLLENPSLAESLDFPPPV